MPFSTSTSSEQPGRPCSLTQIASTVGGWSGTGKTPLNMRPAEQSKPRLLLIEDSLEAQMLVRRFLSTWYLIDAHPSSRDAVMAATATPYDIVLTDIKLGYNDTGLYALDALRQHAHYAEAPIVALTAYALAGDREHFLDAGFDAYVSKPFTREKLLETLQRLSPSPEQHGRA